MDAYTVASCYKFIAVNDLDLFKRQLLLAMKEHQTHELFVLVHFRAFRVI